MDIVVPISVGELIDKITILRIKQARIADPAKRAHVANELTALEAVARRHGLDGPALEPLTADLMGINTALWDIEDDIRECERMGDFGPRFIALARSVYITNDERARIKKVINLTTGSALVEEKSYVDHGASIADGADPTRT